MSLLGEAKTELVTTLTGDDTLTALLASDSAVYQDRPPRDRTLPCITFRVNEAPDNSVDEDGKHALSIQIDLWATTLDTLDSILDALDDALSRKHRSGTLDTTNYVCRACYRQACNLVNTGLEETAEGLEIRQYSTDWTLRYLLQETE